MQSIFHSETTERVNGREYLLESDQTMEGTPTIEVTDVESGNSWKFIQKSRDTVEKTFDSRHFPSNVETVLLMNGIRNIDVGLY